MNRWTKTAAALFAVVPCALAADVATNASAADSQTKVIGFRNGDRGVFPDDCKPPLKFNGVTGENLVWKTPMPNFGNAGVIVIGKQVIVLCDVGWPAGEGDTPTLRSYDADTGKPLWTRPIDPYDCLSPEEAKVLRPLRAKFFEAARLEDEAMHRLGLLKPDDAGGRARILDEVAAKTGIDRELLDSNKRFFTNGPGGHNHGPAPFASGNRLLIRTYDWLYCFGDKSAAFRPSQAFVAK